MGSSANVMTERLSSAFTDKTKSRAAWRTASALLFMLPLASSASTIDTGSTASSKVSTV